RHHCDDPDEGAARSTPRAWASQRTGSGVGYTDEGRSTRCIVRPARTPWRHSKSSSTTLRTSAFSPCSYSAAWGYQSRRNCRSSRPAVLSHEGIVRWWLALPLCLLGVFSGDVVLCWVGRHWGEQLLNWRMVRLVLSPASEQWLKTASRRPASKT